ncbi:cytosine permease [Ktedonosporobacter rubrisoli]|uniref:Cytosine permease n=1 Tax=Ktedonosporobacter rubrisoli TaxID=2509675 RepID=A0A4P6JZK4_KTERU|nr:cytosine permease [Ktedonosporobacter rubrisoli]QBD81338.1 cytosine permease [Ktedonosporobacter rubrisoli]
MSQARRTFGVERRSIDFIPETERHGKVRSLFTLWFSANMQITTVVTGALAVSIGLSLGWAIVAIVVGNLLGGIFMALHSAQGPRMGIPQMIQSRAQFGYFGAILPLLLVIVMYIGFFASSGVLGGQALAAWTGLPVTPSIIIVAIICTALAIFGYDLIHRYEGIVSAIFAIGFLYLTIRLLTGHSLAKIPAPAFSLGTFLLVISVIATWQLTYGPYVADYSRYLPARTSIATSFFSTYAGSVISSIWMMGFGAVAVAIAGAQFNTDAVRFVVEQAGPGLAFIFYILVVLGIIGANVLNLYGVFLSSTTTIAALQRFSIDLRTRIFFVLGAAIVGTAVAVVGQGNFVENYTNFLLFLLYFIIPWSGINLVDFYLIRHEVYDIDAIFDPNGIYGRVNWRALLVYVLAIVLELPFVSTTIYTGPLVAVLGGADIAWIVGLLVSAVLYYLLARAHTTEKAAPTVIAETAPED